jgi:hypothetical protein
MIGDQNVTASGVIGYLSLSTASACLTLQHPDIDGSDYSKLLAGHLGYLTASQEKSLETFKQCLHSEGLYDPKAEGSGRPSHDDTTLLCVHNPRTPSGLVDIQGRYSRFLRARKFDVGKAHKQFTDTSSWRAEHDVENLYSTFDPDEMESAKRFYPRWTGRRDKVIVLDSKLPVF